MQGLNHAQKSYRFQIRRRFFCCSVIGATFARVGLWDRCRGTSPAAGQRPNVGLRARNRAKEKQPEGCSTAGVWNQGRLASMLRLLSASSVKVMVSGPSQQAYFMWYGSVHRSMRPGHCSRARNLISSGSSPFLNRR